jgi:hypothetical protein
MNRKQRNILNFLALFFLLIILPVAALYFLDMGVDYRKELMAELGDHGKTPGFSLVDVDGDTIDFQDLKRRMSIVNFMSLQDDEHRQIKGETLQKLQTQFGDREEVVFLNFIPRDSNDSIGRSTINNFKASFELQEAERCFFLREDSITLQRMAMQGYGFSYDDGNSYLGNPNVAFCDTSQTIRRHYNLLDAKDNQLLVRHLVMFLPAGESREGKYEIE